MREEQEDMAQAEAENMLGSRVAWTMLITCAWSAKVSVGEG
jgi:hypothetical protein